MIAIISRHISRRARSAGLAAALVGASIAAAPVQASDLDVIVGSPMTEGVDCLGPLAKTLPHVWLGHFTGGYSHYTGPGGVILLDWRDEKLCFPTRRSCDRWVHGLRSDYHHPEGYFTCLTIR